MKKTLITVALTTVVVLTLIGIVSSTLFSPRASQFNTISRNLDAGYGGGAPQEIVVNKEVLMPASAPMVGSGGGDGSVVADALDQNSNISGDGTRLVIKNADLAIVVKDPKASMTEISKLAETMGGFVVSSNLYQSYYGPNNTEVPEATITIRVPVEKLDEALGSIKKSAVDITSENVSGQDVTSEYVDLQSRLTAKQLAEKKLTQILDAADKTEDVLAVYTQLQLIQTDIEVLKGQIKYYEESASLSAISVRLIAEAGTQPIAIGPWTPSGTAKNAIQDLIYFFQNFVEFLIRFVLYNLPSLILIGIPLYLVFLGGRAVYRKLNKKSPVLDPVSEYINSNDSDIDKITDIDELGQKIKEGEILAAIERADGWIPLIVSLVIVISIAINIPKSEIYLILTGFGLLYLGFNIWRVYNANKKKKEIESKIKEYRNKIAELETKKTR